MYDSANYEIQDTNNNIVLLMNANSKLGPEFATTFNWLNLGFIGRAMYWR